MSKKSLDEKNNDYISYKSSKIVFCQDGRILLIDKDTELVDLRDCENCKQKDQLIAELGKALKDTNKLMLDFMHKCLKLEEEKQTAVKEFAKTTLVMLNKYSRKRIIRICDNVLENNMNLLLRERGIE